jgi:spermidine synthase
MSALFEELAYSQSSLGELYLRRRRNLSLGIDIYEIKLNEEFLMSSLFNEGEQQLAHLGLAPLENSKIDVVVGGLGLGYTAKAALEHENVESLYVIETLPEVITWHQEKLLPLGEALIQDSRCRMVLGDFFEMTKGAGFDPDQPGRLFHAILVDIDHAPDFALHQSHLEFYAEEGLTRLLDHLHPSGVFALWSNDPPDESFCERLSKVFASAEAHVVSFHNPLQDSEATDTIYVAQK